ncbi:AraC family transcriptional regulator [Actinomadura kijaniata]|uniref:AraC family transcriptional regulator n=1 Tax=Actinomadura kijaniata TaxID=46161 RepID=UPI00082E7610|nr:AraC family transcriptional regulator [Actinomadura kijaniata]
MDALTDLLDGVRARGALFSQTLFDPPWGLRFATRAPLHLVAMLRGTGWVVPDAGEPVRLETGDVAIVRGPRPFTVADRPGTPPCFVVHDAETCTMPDGSELRDEIRIGPRLCGMGRNETDLLLSGMYEVGSEVSRRLLAALPEVLRVPAAEYRSSAMDLVTEEIARDAPGQQVVLDRLLDLVLISTLRHWFDRPDARPPAWYAAMSDPVVGRALRLMHDDPARSWTVASLAAGCGVSRAALARRFTAMVGEPPMGYLTDWRITLAAELLRGTDATVGAIARRVGYANAFALSVAFKRLRGVTPTEYRDDGGRAGDRPAALHPEPFADAAAR